jgi:hypothetical protein
VPELAACVPKLKRPLEPLLPPVPIVCPVDAPIPVEEDCPNWNPELEVWADGLELELLEVPAGVPKENIEKISLSPVMIKGIIFTSKTI